MGIFKAPVGISNRHIHLSEEHIEALFGAGYTLTKTKDLSQPGQFACEETITLIGPKGSITGVRVLGPARKVSQVELTETDRFKIGVKPPVRDSGKLEGTPGIEVEGPKGRIHLDQGVIIAARHIHMTPEDATKYSVKDGDHVSVAIPGPRGGILERVLVRVSPDYALDLHLDTDEGNAFGLVNGQELEIYSK
ncbi:phosphate propanoyltransferase [Desulfosporosinus sp. BICA1-9]|uniref:phosphate propanoyltransferase n=1 Tax=Desulfosporosinus sp. BICA1-9 TaxID=1531958 RepID=UPI00054C1F20|nr:phosphate propanoyltransferase [Desulfosporosinus sp. BICA1-9]KJS50881.1 MAG: propanediol utilization protein [Peptococcaceae bacterium BRH_c23]KJS79425.1 MAG: propanediol utilization protein [Desulfosporosinus sp. BICA1-9]HBW37432.1 phosphate propanoyltransferase [Desulfosporosinus sp.]